MAEPGGNAIDQYGWFITAHVLAASLPQGFPLPRLRKRARDAYTHVGAGGWDRYMPPEDSAIEPDMEWTEAHRVLVRTAYQQEWGRFLEDNQTYDIVWAPRGYLTTEGYVVSGQPGACVEHGDEDCEDCDEFEEVLGEVTPAEWSWSAKIETYEWNGRSGVLENTEWFHFLTTRLDPRAVDYEG